MRPKIFLVLLLLGGIHDPAWAGVMFQLGNNPQPDEQNILYTSIQSGVLVTGVTNNTNELVDFSSTTDTLLTTALGQANLTASDNTINDITIALPGAGVYADLIINPRLGGAAAGLATVTVVAGSGTFAFSYPGGLANGNNFLTITATNGDFIRSTTIDASFEDLRQPRISGIAAIPEPGSLGLLAVGLLALRRQKGLLR